MEPRHVVIVGAMATGKSTVGRRVAAVLGRPLRDSDDDLAADLGISARELAGRYGVDALHRWEAGHLLRSLASDTPAVVAAAASTVDDARCRAALAEQVVVWLVAPPSVLAARRTGSADAHRRDVAAGEGDLAGRRAAAFRSVADIVVELEAEPTGEAVARARSEAARAGSTVTVRRDNVTKRLMFVAALAPDEVAEVVVAQLPPSMRFRGPM